MKTIILFSLSDINREQFNYGLLAVFILAIVIFVGKGIREMVGSDDDDDSFIKPTPQSPFNVFVFNLKNNSDEAISLDLCKLDSKDERYSFSNLDGDYDMMVEYLKVHSFFVSNTRVHYQSDNWKDVIYSKGYTPFSQQQKPIVVAFDNLDKCQYQSLLVDSKMQYVFDYFNSLQTTLNPKEQKTISLMLLDDGIAEYRNEEGIELGNQYVTPKCALSIKNNSDTMECVKLFDKDYLTKITADDSEIKKIEIESVFGIGEYPRVVGCFDSQPLFARYIKMYLYDKNSSTNFKVNDIPKVSGAYRTANQFQPNVIDVDLGSEIFVANFEIEIEPHSEILISFK